MTAVTRYSAFNLLRHACSGHRYWPRAWRDPALPPLEKGRTTQSDVMRELGPPSQVIALHDQTLFYYLREQFKSDAMFLILYNQTRERITYDRAIFFFNQKGVLTDFAFSNESIPQK